MRMRSIKLYTQRQYRATITICTGTNSLLLFAHSQSIDVECCKTLVVQWPFHCPSLVIPNVVRLFHIISLHFQLLVRVCVYRAAAAISVDSHLQCTLILSGWIYIYVHWVMVLWPSQVALHIVDTCVFLSGGYRFVWYRIEGGLCVCIQSVSYSWQHHIFTFIIGMR